MSWSAIEATVRSAAESIRGDVTNLRWSMAAVDRPRALHVAYSIIIESTAPMGVGVNAEGPPYKDRTLGRCQFDVYAPAGESHLEALADCDAIRAKFRGLRVGGVRFETPQGPLFQGRDGAYFRWTVDCPFVAEEM